MNRIIYKSLVAIGLMGLAYYISNPRKYNKLANGMQKKAAKGLAKHT